MGNLDISRPADGAKIGTPLWAHVSAISTTAIYFKLNLGKRFGVVNTPSALRRFLRNPEDLAAGTSQIRVGDAVRCVVSGVSVTGRYFFLDKYDHDWNYFDFGQRPIVKGGIREQPAEGR